MKGILFKPDMIQAIIEGRKTQTRRLGGLKEINQEPDKWILGGWDNGYEAFVFYKKPAGSEKLMVKPRYQVAETVYVKEAGVWDKQTGYRAYKSNMPDVQAKWQSPLFMPEWAARYFITITNVRAERLQEITEEDADREGFSITYEKYEPWTLTNARTDFLRTWNSINKDYPWESNPWDFAYAFKQDKEKMKRKYCPYNCPHFIADNECQLGFIRQFCTPKSMSDIQNIDWGYLMPSACKRRLKIQDDLLPVGVDKEKMR